MKIVVDENIPYVREAFGTLGEVLTLPGRSLSREHVRDAQVLIVRSVTRVNAELLDGTDVGFVATATIGFDHIDRAYLDAQSIAFGSAPGSNAVSVAEYVMRALVELADRGALTLEDATLGVIGVGNVGSRVVRMATALGMRPVLNDPPLERLTADAVYRPLDEALACDIVTMHVPLDKTGPDATYHMANAGFFRRMKPGAIFINSSRGAVVDDDALLDAIGSGALRAAVLDVYAGEPEIDWRLVERAALATPHIAGYSFDGKVRGTLMVYQSACHFLRVKPIWRPNLPPAAVPVMTFLGRQDPRTVILSAMNAGYDITRDDAALREALALPDGERAAHFDRLRKTYPIRREFHNTTVMLMNDHPELAGRLAGLGFKVRTREA